MRKCKKCGIEYNGIIENCPLCQAELTGDSTLNVFPKLKNQNQKLLYKILLFVSFTIGVLFSFSEYYISKSFFITKYVLFGLLTNYVLIKAIFDNYKNVLKMMNRYFIIVIILLFAWFILTKSLIITTYLIPILCIIIFLFNGITMIVLKDSYIIKFIKTILINCILGLIPIIFVIFKLTTFDLISYICIILDLLVFVGLLIFCKENVLEELKKIVNF